MKNTKDSSPKQKFFHKAKNEFFSKHQDVIRYECQFLKKKSSHVKLGENRFFKISDTFILISKVFK